MLKHFPSKKDVAGCDEAGRGCLAGPVVAAAVILPKRFKNNILNDSKVLSKKKREFLCPIIKEEAIAWAVGIVSPAKIQKKWSRHPQKIYSKNCQKMVACLPGTMV